MRYFKLRIGFHKDTWFGNSYIGTHENMCNFVTYFENSILFLLHKCIRIRLILFSNGLIFPVFDGLKLNKHHVMKLNAIFKRVAL